MLFMITKHHHHHITKLVHLKTKLGKLYSHLLLQALAVSMLSIFVPIHLLRMGFPLSEVFLFLLVEWGIFSLAAPFTAMVISKVGLKEVILIRTPLIVISLILLSLMPSSLFLQSLYLPIGALIGISLIFYTLSISSLFSEFMHKKKKNSTLR